MWLVAGLGNPGSTYRETRHNVGFRVAQRLAARDPSARWHTGGPAHWSRARLARQDLCLLKPQTFMNRSGEAVAPALDELGLEPTALIVVHDDVDLPLGRLRIKSGGGHGGHNGLRSLEAELDTREFLRVRVGIGRPPPGGDVVEWVLGPFEPDEQEALGLVLERAADAVVALIDEGLTVAANRFNAAPRPAASPTTEKNDRDSGKDRKDPKPAGNQDST